MSKNIPAVVITKITPNWRPFQIFILGLYELERLGEIKLKFRCDWFYRLSTILPDWPHLGGVMHQLALHFLEDTYTMEGYVKKDGDRHAFCIDCCDSPAGIDGDLLKKVKVYFKMQCPKVIDIEKGFRLADDVYSPFYDYQHKDKKLKVRQIGERLPLHLDKNDIIKIKPCVVGFRRLSDGNSYTALSNGWENYKNDAVKQAKRKVMCYYGNACGPRENMNTPIDWNSESNIMGMCPSLNHPNEKRARVAQIMQSLGDAYDARIINSGTMEKPQNHTDLIIPIEKFCAHISNFQYNYNVSGYRMSIPNRFMESFIVGTAIITDKLAVKWYLPFDEEVVETVEMGYIPQDQVNWEKVKEDLVNLPNISKDKVLAQYEKKWAPIPVARYLVATVLS
ncbi:MAG: hypothetical protein IJP52_04070 [Paludibacteraceae bacterium]|nr:hypothetical protein [Paludibacteraceae bacterium]